MVCFLTLANMVERNVPGRGQKWRWPLECGRSLPSASQTELQNIQQESEGGFQGLSTLSLIRTSNFWTDAGMFFKIMKISASNTLKMCKTCIGFLIGISLTITMFKSTAKSPACILCSIGR